MCICWGKVVDKRRGLDFQNFLSTYLLKSTNIFLVKNFSVSATRLRSLFKRYIFDKFWKSRPRVVEEGAKEAKP